MKIRINFGMVAIPMAAGLIFAQTPADKPAAKAVRPAAQQLLAQATPANPNAPAPAAAEAPKPITEAQMDEVVVQANSRVTGSKTDTPIHDIPASIAVVPKEIIEDQQAVDMNQMARNVSGVTPTLQGGYGFSDSYTIRGLRMRFLRDGLPDGQTWNGYMRTNTDVESIEVLKGPGSALYGRTEPGGVINIVTKKPMDTFGASFEGMGGSFGTYRGVLDIGGPLGTTDLPSRLNAGYYHTDGYRGLSRTIAEVLPTFTWKISDKQSLTVDYDYRNIKTTPDNYGIIFKTNGEFFNVAKSTVYSSPFVTTKQQVHRLALVHEAKFSSAFKLRSAAIYDNRDLFMIRNAGGSAGSGAFTGQIVSRSAREQTDKISSILLQSEAILKFTTGEIGHTMLGGIEYESYRNATARDEYTLANIMDGNNPVVPEASLEGLPKAQFFNRVLKSQTISAYAQEQVAITQYLKMRAGIRLDHVDFADEGDARTSNITSQYVNRSITAARDLISWQAGAVLQPWKPVSFYSGYAEGRFLSLQSEVVNLTPDPEKTSQIEVGLKTNWFKDRLQTNFAVFRATRENYYAVVTPNASQVPLGRQRTDGIELDAAGNPIKGLWITIAGTVMDPRVLTKDGATAAAPNGFEGKIAQYVSEYSGILWITYELQSGLLKGLGFGGGPHFKSRTFVDGFNIMTVPGYVVADAVLFYRRPNWQLQANFRNITNADYFASPTFSGALPGEPFNFTISAKAKL